MLLAKREEMLRDRYGATGDPSEERAVSVLIGKYPGWDDLVKAEDRARRWLGVTGSVSASTILQYAEKRRNDVHWSGDIADYHEYFRLSRDPNSSIEDRKSALVHPECDLLYWDMYDSLTMEEAALVHMRYPTSYWLDVRAAVGEQAIDNHKEAVAALMPAYRDLVRVWCISGDV